MCTAPGRWASGAVCTLWLGQELDWDTPALRLFITRSRAICPEIRVSNHCRRSREVAPKCRRNPRLGPLQHNCLCQPVNFFSQKREDVPDPHFLWQAKYGCRALVPWGPWPRESWGSRRIGREEKGLVLKPADSAGGPQHCVRQSPPPARKQNQ